MSKSRYNRGSQLMWLLSLFIAVSMIVGTLLSVLPRRQVRATPTPPRPTLTATHTSPTPTLSAPQVAPSQ